MYVEVIQLSSSIPFSIEPLFSLLVQRRPRIPEYGSLWSPRRSRYFM